MNILTKELKKIYSAIKGSVKSIQNLPLTNTQKQELIEKIYQNLYNQQITELLYQSKITIIPQTFNHLKNCFKMHHHNTINNSDYLTMIEKMDQLIQFLQNNNQSSEKNNEK
jgi:ribosomal protein S15P/S13E